MYRSSKNAALILGALAFLNACTKPDNKPDAVNGNSGVEGTATFTVNQVTGKAVLVNPKSIYTNKTDGGGRVSSWRVPRAVSYSFTACIEDRATNSRAKGQTFKVEVPGTNLGIADVTPTTPSGCFTWMETIPFSFYVKNSRWVVVERDIVGAGVHTGRQRVRLAINPWAVGDGAREGGREFEYLRESRLPVEKLVPFSQFDAALSGQLAGDDELIADGVHVKTIRNSERSTGTFLKFEITVEPKVRFAGQPDLDSPRWESIKSGDFFVVAHLVMDKAGPGLNENMILGSGDSIAVKHPDATRYPGVVVERKVGADPVKTEYPVNGFGKVVDGKLVLRMDSWVEGRMAQGNLRLTLKLIPRGVTGLKPFEGIYELGHVKSLGSSFQGDLVEECREANTACRIAEYLKTAKNFAEARAAGLAQLASPYLFEKVRLRFVQVQPGETATQRTVKYQASTCVVDWFTGDKVIGLPFKVSYEDSSEVKDVETLADGCISWTSNIFHNYYLPEKFIEKVVTFEKGNGVTAKRKFYINPWDDKFTFGFDEGDFPEELKNSKKIDSRFFLADYGYHTVSFKYNIDSLMALEVRKTVLMELQPQVLRYSGIINARKMTEPLRDGIWLMKVAIQKNYLDPAQAGVVIDKLQENQAMIRLKYETTTQESMRMHARLREMNIQAQTKEYISTQTALVRVTDGVIIQPVELTMQDLRMMRVRSNFLVQLEAVDERKLQFDNVLRDAVKGPIDDLIRKRQELRAKRRAENINESEAAVLAREEREQEETVNNRMALVRRLFDDINAQLNATGGYRIDLNSREYKNDAAFLEPVRQKLADQLQTNDFTKLKLPSCHDVDCNRFREENSGLEARTFVGPVIFLHNGYKDSVRATDNLDEARCGDVVDYADEDEEILRNKQRQLFNKSEGEIAKVRQNNLYNYSEYFGSLRHLCRAQVDELIEREKSFKKLYEKSGPAVASVYNFVKSYNMDFLSLRDEKPKTVDINEEQIVRCNSDLVSCMQETTDRWLQTRDALSFINTALKTKSPNLWGLQRWFASNPDDVVTTEWDTEILRRALFETVPKAKNAFDIVSPRSAKFAACSILMSNIVEQTRLAGGRTPFMLSWEQARSGLVEHCMGSSYDSVTFDRKLRVFKTGQDKDPYIFLGGMQLNLNVGQGFSVSRSQGYNWSAGIELFDMIGPLKGAGVISKAGSDTAGALLKPLSLKTGYGESFSSSDGTSIADSTYLVAQIAGFKVRLDEFERCVNIRLGSDYARNINYGLRAGLNSFLHMNRRILDLSRGVMVCEGKMNERPRQVKESYFYFTQHFTEGDMLDQADLYNHPWLLALRGQRDFGVFLNRIRGQEPITVGNFVKGIWTGRERKLDWPLDHMLAVYKHVTPAFPGFYTELREGETGTELPLERSMSRYDNDINCEVTSSERRANMPGAPVCNARFAR